VIDDIVIRCYGFGYDAVNHKYKVLEMGWGRR